LENWEETFFSLTASIRANANSKLRWWITIALQSRSSFVVVIVADTSECQREDRRTSQSCRESSCIWILMRPMWVYMNISPLVCGFPEVSLRRAGESSSSFVRSFSREYLLRIVYRMSLSILLVPSNSTFELSAKISVNARKNSLSDRFLNQSVQIIRRIDYPHC